MKSSYSLIAAALILASGACNAKNGESAAGDSSAAANEAPVKPPANGEITFQEVRAHVEYPKEHFRAHCNGKVVDAVKALYASREDFTGTDRMQIEVDYKTGYVRRYSVIMDVR